MSEKALFKVGGVYRQKDGQVVCLHIDKFTADPGTAWACRIGLDYGEGFRCLTTGVDTIQLDGDQRDLTPGELHQVNGEWVPLEQSLKFPSGATLQTDGSKIVGREYIRFDCVDCLGCAKCNPEEAAQIARDKSARRAVKWVPPTPVVKAPLTGAAANPHPSPFAAKTMFRSPDIGTSHLHGAAHLLPKG